MAIGFSLMKSIEVSFPGSSDQFELKTGVLCLSTPVFSSNSSDDPWDVYARGFIGLNHATIIDGQLSATNFDFIWSWKIYPPENFIDQRYFEDDILLNVCLLLNFELIYAKLLIIIG